jgi:cell wall assembly regulator SMI1
MYVVFLYRIEKELARHLARQVCSPELSGDHANFARVEDHSNDGIREIWQAIMTRVKTTDDPGLIKMFTYRILPDEFNELADWCGSAVPAPLREFYSQPIYEHPWEGVSFPDPRHIHLRDLNDMFDTTPPLQVPPQVREPVSCGPKLIPFASVAHSYYCLDCDPVLEAGGVLHQVVRVSFHTGKITVVASNLETLLRQGLETLEKQSGEPPQGGTHDELDFGSAVENSLAGFRQKAAAGEISPAFATFAESFMGMITEGMNAIQTRTEAGMAPQSFDEAAALFHPETLKDAHKARMEEYLQSLPRLPPRLTDCAELKTQAHILIKQNPHQHPVQKACARLMESYVAHAEMADPSFGENKLIERINDTTEGLGEEAIQEYEEGLGITFPEDLRALLLAHEFIAHGGERASYLGLASDLVENCRQLNELFAEDADEEDRWALWPGTRTPVMGKHLIPIGWDEPMLCYDLNPSSGGVVGQLVSVDIECSTCQVEYPSLLAFLEESIREVESL